GAAIEGHASAEGSAEYNLRLSQRRAEAVRDALVAGGLQAGRMRVLALGESDPIASNDDPEGRIQNRRVVIIVTPGDALRW
ncbi:MAG: OmpA family protein, partial [Erythrobacter cryptus]